MEKLNDKILRNNNIHIFYEFNCLGTEETGSFFSVPWKNCSCLKKGIQQINFICLDLLSQINSETVGVFKNETSIELKFEL